MWLVLDYQEDQVDYQAWEKECVQDHKGAPRVALLLRTRCSSDWG